MASATSQRGSPTAGSPAVTEVFGAITSSESFGLLSRIRPFLAALTLALFAAVPASKAQSSAAQPVPDFLLRDANPNSPRSTQTVSPRDYRLQISAYYFGAAG